MPRERRSTTTGEIIAEPAKWTPEEILVWLDYQKKLDKEEDKRLDLEYYTNSRFLENSHTDIWNRVVDKVARESKRYIL